jgi:hypothetical protein
LTLGDIRNDPAAMFAKLSWAPLVIASVVEELLDVGAV